MERFVIGTLEKWKTSSRRKPLLMLGARQVGKTWALKEFGRRSYHNYVHIDFERQEEYRSFFQTTRDPLRIIENLSAATGEPILPNGETLLIFDEIQECPEALTSLKYFCEDASAYHVACAGSLLGLSLANGTSYPVGKVNVIDLFPLSFSEFLLAGGKQNLYSYMEGITAPESIAPAFFNPLSEQLKIYCTIGGLPEPLSVWFDSKKMDDVSDTLRELQLLYELDFHKHAKAIEVPKIDQVWRSLPSQLARENKKFMYSLVREGARAREYENAVIWLNSADMVHQVFRVSKPGIPLSAYDDLRAFKLYLLDTGLLRHMSRLVPSAIAEGNRVFTEFKGALAENFVMQEIACAFASEGAPRYWATDNPHYEVDFLMQYENHIIPIEVKSGESVKATSLKKYRERFAEQTPCAVRLSMRNLSYNDGILNVPLFMAGQLKNLLGAVL